MVGLPLADEAFASRFRRLIRSRPRPAHSFAWAMRHRLFVGAIVYAASSLWTLNAAVFQWGQAWALLALLALPAAYVLRDRPRLAALAFVGGGIVMRLALAGIWQADSVAVTGAAAQAALNGYNPYGHGFGAAVPPGAPFPYGPLALLAGLGGQPVETAASIGTMLLFVATGSYVLLGLYAADSFAVFSATQGVNDLTPGLLIAVGLLLLQRRPMLGGAVLAVAAAIKPYAFAWFPAAVGFAGIPALVGLLAGSAVLWSPLLSWGTGNYLKSVAMARAVHPIPNSLNIPELRVLGVPLAVMGLWARRWEVAVAGGAAVFIVVLFFDRWASAGYWLAVLPICGIALEGWLVRNARAVTDALRGADARTAYRPATEWRWAGLGNAPARTNVLATSTLAADTLESRELPSG